VLENQKAFHPLVSQENGEGNAGEDRANELLDQGGEVVD